MKPTPHAIERAKSILVEGLKCHEDWDNYLRGVRGHDPIRKASGNRRWQQKWIRNYRHVLKVLNDLVSLSENGCDK